MKEDLRPSPGLHADPAAVASPQALADRRELCFIAVERTRMPMVVTDPRQRDNPIVLANSSFLDLTGYSAAEIIGRNCRFLQGPGTDQAVVAEIRTGLAEQREVNAELLNYRKDGSEFWNKLYISPVHGESGELLYFFASQLDVTEQRRIEGLEASEHRLLKEVDHRALNALAVVEGIVRLTRQDDPGRYAAAVQRRVQALARAHALLADCGWVGAPLDRLIKMQAEPFGSRRIQLEGPPVEVPAARVQGLALVFHEMAANAAMHGALSAPTGNLTVHWLQHPDTEDVEIWWEENGGPPPPAVRPPGFGSVMIKATLERQLGGKLDRIWAPAGLQAKMSIPKAKPAAAPEPSRAG